MISIIDFGMGNLRSVQKAFERCKVPVKIVNKPSELSTAEKIILPGVGHFANGIKKLEESGLASAIKEAVLVKKTPIMGICLGMQLMTSFSEEGNENGLGWIEARTEHFPVNSAHDLKIPHIGWNTITVPSENLLFKGIDSGALFYFVHSYYVKCINKPDSIAKTTYGIDFDSAFNKNNIFGVQFHPEKSHQKGLKVLANFASI